MNPNHINTASHVQMMAQRSGSERLAFVLNGLSVALLAIMVIKEFRDEFRHKEKQGRGRG